MAGYASDIFVKLLLVKAYEVKRSIEHSMREGAARILDRSRTFSDDPKQHAIILTQRAVAAQQGSDAAWEDVVDGMSRLVFRTSETYFWKWHSHLPAQASFDDVFMAGMEGLMIGARKFDESKGFMLTTYATNWIRTKVQRACYAQCGSARIPEEILQAGLAPGAPMVASSTWSLDRREDDDDMALHETIASTDEADVHELDGMVNVIDILRSVDEAMPDVAHYLELGYADREIARITRLTVMRVGELRIMAKAALQQAGFR